MYQNGALGGIAFGGRESRLKSLITAVFIFVYNARVAPVAQLDRVPPSEGGTQGENPDLGRGSKSFKFVTLLQMHS